MALLRLAHADLGKGKSCRGSDRKGGEFVSLKSLSERMRELDSDTKPAREIATLPAMVPLAAKEGHDSGTHAKTDSRGSGARFVADRIAKRREEKKAKQTDGPSLARAQGNEQDLIETPSHLSMSKVKDVNKPPFVKKIQKKAAQLIDLMTEDDVHADIQVIRDARQAVMHLNRGMGKTIEVPDHRIRLAATQFSRAYAEGLPVARQMTITAELATLDDAVTQLKSSPEAARMLQLLAGSSGPIIDVQEVPPQNEHPGPE